jgi:hypothetical protein
LKTRLETNLVVEVGFGGLGRIQLETIPDIFTRYMTCGFAFINFAIACWMRGCTGQRDYVREGASLNALGNAKTILMLRF